MGVPKRLVVAAMRWLGDLTMPRGLSVVEIGEHHVAGVERDDTGIEYVRVYRLVKP